MFDREKLREIEKKKKELEERILKEYLKKNPERKEKFVTNSEQEIRRLYTPLDLEEIGFDYLKDSGFPGDYPYTRGIDPNMYRSQFWTMSQYAGYGSAEDTNKWYKYLLKQGQKGNSVAFDLPTQLGYDSDHPMSFGEVGKVGVAVDTLADMEILFDGISIGEIRQSMTINASASIILAMYIAIAEKQGIDKKDIEVFLQNDILKEYIGRGAYVFPVKPSLRLVTDIIEYCAKNMPKSSPQRVCGYHMRESGATATQEVGFTLSNAITYIKSALERGLSVDDFAPGLLIFLSGDNEFFEEVAKFRATRKMWAQLMKEKFGAKNPKSMQIRFFGYSSGSTLTAQQPLNNIIRVSLEALAMILGGGQFIFLSSYDEAKALPSEESIRIALRTQQIIANETGVADTVDPLSGSYYVEYLTSQIEKGAQEYIDRIEKMGGSVVAIERGYIQEEIAKEAYKKQREIEQKKKIIVGVNEYKIDEKEKREVMKINPEVEKKQIERLNKAKRERDNKKVEEALKKVREAAKGNQNIVPVMIEAVKTYASIGEICGVLREVFGKYEGRSVF